MQGQPFEKRTWRSGRRRPGRNAFAQHRFMGIAEVAKHFSSGERAPATRSVGAQMAEALNERVQNLIVRDCPHAMLAPTELSFGVACCPRDTLRGPGCRSLTTTDSLSCRIRTLALRFGRVPRGRPTVRVKGSTHPLPFLTLPSIPRPNLRTTGGMKGLALSKEGRCLMSDQTGGSAPNSLPLPDAPNL